MKIIVLPTYDALSRAAAELVVNRMTAGNSSSCQLRVQQPGEANRPFVLGLPTGSTPIGMYDCLVEACRSGRISFRNVVTFNMDEYVGIPEDHPQSYHTFMHEHLFRHIDIEKENIHIPDGCAPDLLAACKAYETAIAATGGVCLFVGGIGSDGHLAFNEPSCQRENELARFRVQPPVDEGQSSCRPDNFESFAGRTHIATLAPQTIRDNARFFGGDEAQVPAQAITVGLQTILDAREILILAVGENKARALEQAFTQPPSPACPASVLQRHPRVTVLADIPAASRLPRELISEG